MGLDRLGGRDFTFEEPLELLGPQSQDEQLRGLEYLGGWENPAGSAAVASSAIVNFPLRDTVVVMARVVWGVTAGHAVLRVGAAPGVLDTGPNFWSRNAISRGKDTGTLGSSDGGLFFGTKEVNAARWLLQGTTDNGTTQARALLVTINNGAGMAKTASWLVSRSAGLASSSGPIGSGWGEYTNVAGQIQCIQLGTADGSANLGPVTGLGVFGRNHV